MPRTPVTGRRAPLSMVLAAVLDGAVTAREVSERTGLRPELVSAAVEHLVRMGRLVTGPAGSGCAAQGCAVCPVVTGGAGGASPTPCGTRRGSFHASQQG